MDNNLLETIITKVYNIEKSIPFEDVIFEGVVDYPLDGEVCGVTNTEIKKGKYYRIKATLLIPIEN
jgi:hypothetical protein